jgi:hypothetical protein
MNKLIFLDQAAEIIVRHLSASAPNEEGAFCLIRQGQTATGLRLLATDVLLPPPGAWESQGIDQLRPTAQWLSAAIGSAIEAKTGLLFLHSHPDARFPAGFSPVDRSAFVSLARDLAPMLDGPFAAGVVHPDGWSGMIWSEGVLQPIERIMALGRTLKLLSPVPFATDTTIDARQRDALGLVHDRLRRLTVGVVGCGGTGSPIAEQLVRMGVASIILVDPKLLQTPSNVRRVFGSKMTDLRVKESRPKIEVVGDHLDQIGLGVGIQRIHGDVRVETVFRRLLDADVILNATDTHGSRAVVNEFASTYMLPVIDVGVRVGSKSNQHLTDADHGLPVVPRYYRRRRGAGRESSRPGATESRTRRVYCPRSRRSRAQRHRFDRTRQRPFNQRTAGAVVRRGRRCSVWLCG